MNCANESLRARDNLAFHIFYADKVHINGVGIILQNFECDQIQPQLRRRRSWSGDNQSPGAAFTMMLAGSNGYSGKNG